MSNLVKTNKELVTFDDEKLKVIKNSLAKSLNENEFSFFIEAAKSRQLDPLMNQIHAVKRKDKNGHYTVTLQVGIDGFRVIAHRDKSYAGQDETIFTYGTSNKFPEKAKVTVYKIVQGMRVSFTATAKWSEYYPSNDKQSFMWKKMPETMLEKCAEAKALRKAFPSELAGIYTEEEMHQSNEIVDVTPSFEAPKKNHDKLVQAFMGVAVSKSDILQKFELEELSDLTDDNIEELRSIYNQLKDGEKSKQEFFEVEEVEIING